MNNKCKNDLFFKLGFKQEFRPSVLIKRKKTRFPVSVLEPDPGLNRVKKNSTIYSYANF